MQFIFALFLAVYVNALVVFRLNICIIFCVQTHTNFWMHCVCEDVRWCGCAFKCLWVHEMSMPFVSYPRVRFILGCMMVCSHRTPVLSKQVMCMCLNWTVACIWRLFYLYLLCICVLMLSLHVQYLACGWIALFVCADFITHRETKLFSLLPGDIRHCKLKKSWGALMS